MSVTLQTDPAPLQIEPLTPTIGAVVRGVRMSGDLPDACIDAIRGALLDGLHAIHGSTRYFGGNLSDEKRAEMQREYPDARHPVVRTHPETGAKSIYVNAAFTSHIEGMEEDESRRLLRRLYRQASIPEVQCRFRWEKDSVAFWDNRAVQHYAAFDYLPATRRVERVTIEGDRPFCGPAAGERR